MALILVAGLVVALLPDSDPGQTATPPLAVSPTHTTAAAEPTTALPTAVPSTTPTDVTWELVGQVAVPVSASAGPANISSGTATGYAHTPVGALIAAAQISTRAGFSAGRASWEPTIERQFVPSADRDRLLAALKAAPESAAAQPGELSQIAGFIYQSYTPDTAVIGLVHRAPSAGTPRYHVLTLTLIWDDGDWRMVAPPGGTWTSINRQAADLTGVVKWGAR